jgi:hypothetical protein
MDAAGDQVAFPRAREEVCFMDGPWREADRMTGTPKSPLDLEVGDHDAPSVRSTVAVVARDAKR